MTSRERVKRALTFSSIDRIPRDLWILPIALKRYDKQIKAILKKFPPDIEKLGYNFFNKNRIKEDPYKIGTYMDEWGCIFKNVQEGIIGEVKEPIITNLADINKVKPPYKLLDILSKGRKQINKNCRKSDKFILGGWANPFERMQWLRGTPNLYMDIIDQPPQFFELRDIVHKYFLKEIKIWTETEVDGVIFADDWGAQNSLLISPKLWKNFFKPLYKDYCNLIHSAGKFAFMHSDGYIFDIYEDLIEIGVDAINSQLFCMDIEKIGKKFKGRITFWGEMDRQHILPSKNSNDVREAVKRLKQFLDGKCGGMIAQCEFGAAARFENVRMMFEEWEKYK